MLTNYIMFAVSSNYICLTYTIIISLFLCCLVYFSPFSINRHACCLLGNGLYTTCVCLFLSTWYGSIIVCIQSRTLMIQLKVGTVHVLWTALRIPSTITVNCCVTRWTVTALILSPYQAVGASAGKKSHALIASSFRIWTHPGARPSKAKGYISYCAN